jgi:hypothetical protein
MNKCFAIIILAMLLVSCTEKPQDISPKEALAVAAAFGNHPAAMRAAHWCVDIQNKGRDATKQKLQNNLRNILKETSGASTATGAENEVSFNTAWIIGEMSGWASNLLSVSEDNEKLRGFFSRCIDETRRMTKNP